MDGALRKELEEALLGSSGQLGRVFEATRDGVVTNRELVEMGIVANQGVASNLRITIKSLLDGEYPNGPSRAAQSRRSIGGLLRDNPDLSQSAVNHIEMVRTRLEEIETSGPDIEVEGKRFEQTTKKLERGLAELPGIYVYTLPSFLRTVLKSDPDRFWFKVGRTERVAGKRVGEQARATGLPEDPFIVRVYRHPTLPLSQLESLFHRLLVAAGHSKSSGRYTGREWYSTNLEFLDAIALSFECQVDGEDQASD